MKIEVKGRVKGTKLISSIIWEDNKISTDEHIMVLLEMQDKLNTCVKIGPYEDYCSGENHLKDCGVWCFMAIIEQMLEEGYEVIGEVPCLKGEPNVRY